MEKQVSSELERLMEGRQIYQHKGGEAPLPRVPEKINSAWTPWPPSFQRGTCWGSVVFVGRPEELEGGEVEYKLAQSIAGFLGRHMEG